MKSKAFKMYLKPGMEEEYRRRHAEIWPELIHQLREEGVYDYSIFLDRPTGTLFGYYETDDDEAARAYLASSAVAARWEASMAAFFTDLPGRADQAATPLTEVFNLHDQLTESTPS